MSITIEEHVHFTPGCRGRKRLKPGPKPTPKPKPSDPVPRISRLMALAIHFDGLIREGVVRDYADLARLGGVSRARITQIMNFLNLPPRKQKELLFLGEDSGVTERELRNWNANFTGTTYSCQAAIPLCCHTKL